MRLKFLNPRSMLDGYRQRLADAEDILKQGMLRRVENRRQRLLLYLERLNGLSPLKQLGRGYSVVSDTDGEMVTSVKGVSEGQKIQVRMWDGTMIAEVRQINPEKQETDK